MISCDPEIEYICPGETPQRCIKYENLCKDKLSSNDCTRTVCDIKISKFLFFFKYFRRM